MTPLLLAFAPWPANAAMLVLLVLALWALFGPHGNVDTKPREQR